MDSLTPPPRGASDTPAKVAIVTVSYGSHDVLVPFLASLGPDDRTRPTVVIADNKAEESVRRLAAESGAGYLPLPQNPGYGGAINETVRSLPADVSWILVSNPDVVVAQGAIDELVRTGEESDDIGAVGPAIREADGSLYPSARRVPSIRLGIGHALLAPIWPSNPWTRRYRQDDAHYRRDAGWLSGACLLVRRSAFEEIGGFDERFFMYFEDVDLGYRLGRAGYRNVYQPAAEVTHTGAHSTRESSDAMLRAHHDSARRFLSVKYPGPMLAPVRWVLGLGISIRSWLVRRA